MAKKTNTKASKTATIHTAYATVGDKVEILFSRKDLEVAVRELADYIVKTLHINSDLAIDFNNDVNHEEMRGLVTFNRIGADAVAISFDDDHIREYVRQQLANDYRYVVAGLPRCIFSIDENTLA